MAKLLRLACIVSLLLAGVACGQKGPLYLPDDAGQPKKFTDR